MDFLLLFIVAFIIIIVFMFLENKNKDVSLVLSPVDNKKYLVQNLDDKVEAANLLAKTKKNLSDLCSHLKTKYKSDKRVDLVIKRFNPDAIVETAQGSKHTSYSINKGEKMVLCLRSRDGKNRLVDPNVLLFVALHELSHIMTKSVGHTQEFWDNFEFILKEAVAFGIYKHIDFNKKPTEYCGVKITDSPLSK